MTRVPLNFGLQCDLLGLPSPIAEHRFAPTRRWRFDYAWPDRMLALEVQGGTFREGGGAHQGAGFLRDCEKFSEAAVLGWRILLVTPAQVRDGAAVELVRRALT